MKAVQYGELAAKRASGVFAYGEATRHFERALAVQDLVDPDDQGKRSDLLLALAEAMYPNGEFGRVIAQVAPEALAIAETMGDSRRASRASRLAADCLLAQDGPPGASQPEYLKWAERAMLYSEPESLAVMLAWPWELPGGRVASFRRRVHCNWRRWHWRESTRIPRRCSTLPAIYCRAVLHNTGTSVCAWRNSARAGRARA